MLLFHMLDQCRFTYKAFAAIFGWASIGFLASMDTSTKQPSSIGCCYDNDPESLPMTSKRTAVAESFAACWVFAYMWFLACVCSHMYR